jgi:hypothetical protein
MGCIYILRHTQQKENDFKIERGGQLFCVLVGFFAIFLDRSRTAPAVTFMAVYTLQYALQYATFAIKKSSSGTPYKEKNRSNALR